MKIKYRVLDGVTPPTKITQGDWIDLRAGEDVEMDEAEYKLISLGIAMEIPAGYEAIVVPRSSTFWRYGIVQANSIGVIDNSYSGNDDIWKFPAIAVRKTVIKKNDRICQFRLLKNQDNVEFESVDFLEGPNRGGLGSTGAN